MSDTQIVEPTITGFRAWLLERGRMEDTAQGYVNDVMSALNHSQGPMGRLRMKLAPKTLRRIKAALRAWCKYTKDITLLDQLEDFRLPPPARVTIKQPLSAELWEKFLSEIDNALYLNRAERALLGIMASRGIRTNDVLNIERSNVIAALNGGTLKYKGKGNKWQEVSTNLITDYLKLLVLYKDWNVAKELISKSARQKSAHQQLSRKLKKVAESIGLKAEDVHLHKLRRTYATHYSEKIGGNLEKLRQHMDWESVTTAAGYTDHNRRAELEKIAEDVVPKKKKDREDG